jgi:transcriptional regulator with XRE-family HTH domain|nr:MAG TPA: Repressor protein CI [Caudoviricetes sp.]
MANDRKKENAFDYNAAFPTRLRALMENRNGISPLGRSVSQTELAKEIGVTRQAISTYALGTSAPDIIKFKAIADFFHVSSDYLLGFTTERTQSKDLQQACKTTGLSESAIQALQFDKQQSKKTNLFDVEDFLIRSFYVSSWASCLKRFVQNAIQIKSLQSKLGADIVEDQTAFFKWQALCEFEKTFNNAIKEFGPLYANSLWIEDQPKYLAARKAEFQRYIERIEAIQANSKSSSASGGD